MAVEPVRVAIPSDYPGRVAGTVYDRETVIRRLEQVGCTVESATAATGPVTGGTAGGTAATGDPASAGIAARLAVTGDDMLAVTPPSWRPDLTDPNDLAEEVIRLEGYENLPSILPAAPAGAGLSESQRLRRRVGRALAAAGYVEILAYPFSGERDFDNLQLPADDARRLAVRLANPLSEDEPLMRTTLLPGLLKTLVRNVGRGFGDVALFEAGLVYRPSSDAPAVAPVLGRRPQSEPGGARLDRVRAARPAAPGRGGAGRGVRAVRLVGQGPGGRLGGRRRGGPGGGRRGRGHPRRPRRPARALAPGPLRRAVRR
ncbi:hypothetical protein GCM10018952_42300 [Streptosporangium vulgare]